MTVRRENIGRGRTVVGPQHPAATASRFMQVLENTARNLALEVDDPFARSHSSGGITLEPRGFCLLNTTQ